MTATANASSYLTPAPGSASDDDASSPELDLALDIAKRALVVSPLFLVVAAAVAGVNGATSAAVGVALVLANFVAAAASLKWAARINLAALMGVAMFGYLLRLAVLFGAVLLLRELAWVHLPSLGLTIVVMHLGLLIWELKYVSLSLAHPGLAPVDKEPRK